MFVRVNGNALLARKMVVTRRFGAAAWNQLFANMAAAYPYFRLPLTAASQIPLDEFLAFHDEMVRRLFAGNVRSFFELGEQSAGWALEEGPYRKLIADRDVGLFVRSFAGLWNTYFAETTSLGAATAIDDGVELEVSKLPQWHPYFEYLVVGYMKGALGLLHANPVEAVRVRGGSAAGYKYVFRSAVGTSPDQSSPSTFGWDRSLSNGALSARELEVLQYIGRGKTNKEIGTILQISNRTVQVHASHIYDKIGVTNRVGAMLWLAEEGGKTNGGPDGRGHEVRANQRQRYAPVRNRLHRG